MTGPTLWRNEAVLDWGHRRTPDASIAAPMNWPREPPPYPPALSLQEPMSPCPLVRRDPSARRQTRRSRRSTRRNGTP